MQLELRLEPVLEGVGTGAAIGKDLRQFLRIDPHTLRNIVIGRLNVGVGRLQRVARRLFQLERLVNQAVDCLLTARLLVVAHLEELLAVCDVEIGDRRAVHEQNDLLGPRRERNCCNDRECDESGGKAAASFSKLGWRNHELLSITARSVRNAHWSQSVWPKRAQAELQHDSVISDRKRDCRIGITAEPVHRQHEAIVHVADAKPRLVEAIVLDVIACRSEQNPVGGYLQRRTGKEAFAAREEAEERLGRIVTIQKLQRPALEIGASLDFETLWGERALVEPAAHRKRVNRIRLIGGAADVIGDVFVEAAVKPGIGDIGVGKGVQPKQAIRLAEHDVERPGSIDLSGVLYADIGSAAAFDAIPAGILVDLEKIAGVEYQALRIFIRKFSNVRLIGSQHYLSDRFDGLRSP